MKSVIKRSRLLAVLGLCAGLMCACTSQDSQPTATERTTAQRDAEPATDTMRLAVLRRAVIANGFVPASQLKVEVDALKRDAGKLIFASPLMSLNDKISCQECHLTEFGSADGLPVALGVGADGIGRARLESGGQIVPRNVLPFWGRGSKGFDTFFWDGKVSLSNGRVISQFGENAPSDDPLIVAAHLPSVELREMVDETPQVEKQFVSENVSAAQDLQAALAQRFAQDPTIGPKLVKAFRSDPSSLGFAQIADALASFIRDEFRIRPTKLELFAFRGGGLSKSELAGGILFYGRGKCAACHTGPYFSDMSFHAVPFPQTAFGKNGFGIDYGRYNVTFDPADRFRFRTPPLFNVAKTAPYSHSGSVATLEQAIVAHFDPLRLVDTKAMSVRERADFYARLGPAGLEPLPSALTDDEVSDLAAYLTTLNF